MRHTDFLFSITASLALAASALAQQPAQPADDHRAMPAANSSSYGDYPATEVQAIPGARANAVKARLEMELIQTNLHRWIEHAWDDFLHSKDYLSAANDEKKAQDEYTRERERVLKKLNDDSSYRALHDLVADLHDKIEREHDRPKALASSEFEALDQMMALATLKLSYASAQSAMESAALNADKSVADARTKLIDAAAKTREMRRGFDRGVRRDPEFLAGRNRYEEARINRVVSSAYLESAINAREIALDYAYYVHRWDQYRYSSGGYYDPYYGNSYYTGYVRRY